MLKAVGGAFVGLGGAALLGHGGLMIVIAGAVIALAANLANLLDLRPARTIKVWAPLAIALIVYAQDDPVHRILASLLGGALVFAVYELREVVMLGDVGANLLGAALGVSAVAVLGDRSLVICAAVLLIVTLVAEVVSFSRVIEAVAPLRWLDHLGRRS
jgi:UDP-N-acetylmuramyl pentapeptide phosphotransferase/UDP-N-acetylglucosamine-1-phosphate transferase